MPCPARMRPLRWTVAMAALVAGSLTATGAAPGPKDKVSLDQFLEASVPLCLQAPAVRCIEHGFGFADANHDGKLSLAEVQAIETQIDGWAKSNAQRLPPEERQKLIVGLLVVQTVGPDQLFASYDTDRDGTLSLAEVTADIRLDKRPLPEILGDPSAIDWNALAARAGSAAPLLKQLFEL
jgi:Ca2+-binding EF-hand superfamily protein